MDYREVEEGWSKIHEGITEMIKLANEQTSKLPKDLYVDLYNQIYGMCTKKTGGADQIYKRYSMTVDEYLREKVLPQIRNKRGTFLLEDLIQLYSHHQTLVKWLGCVFAYVDRHYAKMLNLMGMKEMAWNSFRFLVVDPCIDNVREAMADIIEDNRRGNLKNSNPTKMKLVGQTVKFLLEVGKTDDFYKRNFEDELIRRSITYYKEQKQKLKGDNVDYTHKAEEFVLKERDWIRATFPGSTELRLLDLCCNTLLGSKYQPPAEQQIEGKQETNIQAEVDIDDNSELSLLLDQGVHENGIIHDT